MKPIRALFPDGRNRVQNRISVHGLRHTYASLSLMGGVPVEVVSKQLGHASVAFTLSQYRWVYREERERWALGVEELAGSRN